MSKKVIKHESGKVEDRELISSFNKGSKKAFDTLVLKYQDRVFNLCYRFLGNYEEADDSAQETFIKVYRSLKNFRFESSFSTWLYRIAVNTCKNKLSSLKYRRSREMVRLDNGKGQEGSRKPTEISDESLSPEVKLEKKERDTLIQQAIDSLPADFKTVVVLCDVEGLSYEMTARITGYRIGTVKSKLSRARDRLRIRLGEVLTEYS
jgi:RNA polymerase sigma-70 factor (ECF subfamily)